MATGLRINLNHYKEAQDLLFQLIGDKNSDIVIVSEQYRDVSEGK